MSHTWLHNVLNEDDGLRLCSVCEDRYTQNEDGICWACKHQQMIDDSAPDAIPFAYEDDDNAEDTVSDYD